MNLAEHVYAIIILWLTTEVNFIINDFIKILKQAHFKLVGAKLEGVKKILEKYICEGYAISNFKVYHKADLGNRSQDDRHVKFSMIKENEEECIEISIAKV